MSDPWNTAARYRERAAEHKRLADLAIDESVRIRHRRLAEYYLALATSELKLGASLDAFDTRTAAGRLSRG